jgi:hypothetical protein
VARISAARSLQHPRDFALGEPAGAPFCNVLCRVALTLLSEVTTVSGATRVFPSAERHGVQSLYKRCRSSLPRSYSIVSPIARRSSWPTTARQWSRRRFVGSRNGEEFDDLRIHGRSESFQHANRWVFKPPFQTAHVGAIYPRIDREVLL